MGMQRTDVQGRFSTMLDNFSTKHCDVTFWFQSTHSLRSATEPFAGVARQFEVSIHALLAECDSPAPCLNLLPFVSIHALLAECDYY